MLGSSMKPKRRVTRTKWVRELLDFYAFGVAKTRRVLGYDVQDDVLCM